MSDFGVDFTIRGNSRDGQRAADEMGQSLQRLSRQSVTTRATVQSAMTGLDRHVSGVASNVASSIGHLATTAAIGFGGVAVAGGGMAAALGLHLDSVKEQAQIAFTTMLGSGKQAQQFLKELQTFANNTPFEFQGLVKTSQQLLAMGFAGKELIPTLTAVGDAASALGASQEQIDRVTTALGQMRNSGHLNAQDMNQLVQAGVNGWQYLATASGKSIAEIRNLSQKGQIDAKQASAVILAGMERDFGGMMARQSKTASGLLSTLHDQIQSVLGTVMLPFFREFEKGAARLVAITGDPSFADWAGKIAAQVSGYLIPKVKELIGWFVDHKDDVVGFFRGAYDVATSLAGVVVTVVKRADDLAGRLGGWKQTLELVAGAVVGLKVGYETAIVAMRIATIGLGTTIKAALITTGIGAVAVAAGLAAAYVITHWEQVKRWFEEFANWLGQQALKMYQAILDPFTHLPGALGQWARDASTAAEKNLRILEEDAKTIGQNTGDNLGQTMYDRMVDWTAKTKGLLDDLAATSTGPGSSVGGVTTGAIGQGVGGTPADLINEVAGRTGIPPALLAGLIKVESGGSLQAVGPPNPSGELALGPAQVLPSTAQSVLNQLSKQMLGQIGIPTAGAGAVVPGHITQAQAAHLLRTNASASVATGAIYLQSLFAEMGSWEAALAAYNEGPAAFKKHGSDVASAPSGVRKYVSDVLGIAENFAPGENNAPTAGAGPRSFAAKVSGPTAGLTALQNYLIGRGLPGGDPAINVPTHASPSYHYAGEALDIGDGSGAEGSGTPDNPHAVMGVWNVLYPHRGNLAELFWNYGGFYKFGKKLGGPGSDAIPKHRKHIHVAFVGSPEDEARIFGTGDGTDAAPPDTRTVAASDAPTITIGGGKSKTAKMPPVDQLSGPLAERLAAAARAAAARPTVNATVAGQQAVFSAEGPEFYAQAYARNRQYATAGPYQTKLTAAQERRFRAWVSANNVPFDPNEATPDYDMRGYWLAMTRGQAPKWAGGATHFPDTFKTPYDTTFSRESKYATPDNPLTWKGDNLVNTKTGQLVFGSEGSQTRVGTLNAYVDVLNDARDELTAKLKKTTDPRKRAALIDALKGYDSDVATVQQQIREINAKQKTEAAAERQRAREWVNDQAAALTAQSDAIRKHMQEIERERANVQRFVVTQAAALTAQAAAVRQRMRDIRTIAGLTTQGETAGAATLDALGRVPGAHVDVLDAFGQIAGVTTSGDVAQQARNLLQKLHDAVTPAAARRALEGLKALAPTVKDLVSAAADEASAQATRIADNAQRVIDALKGNIDRARGTAVSGFQAAGVALLAAFDKDTTAMLDRVQTGLQAQLKQIDAETKQRLDAADAAGAGDTPEEAAARQLRAAHDAAQAALRHQGLLDALTQAQQSGDPKQILAAQQALDDEAYQQQQAALDDAAQQSRKARDKDTADLKAHIQEEEDAKREAAQKDADDRQTQIKDDRAATRDRFQARLDEITTGLQNETITVTEAHQALVDLLASPDFQGKFGDTGTILGTALGDGIANGVIAGLNKALAAYNEMARNVGHPELQVAGAAILQTQPGGIQAPPVLQPAVGGGFIHPDSLPGGRGGFAAGGIVPGFDRGYDSRWERVRPGELILTRAQQANVAAQLSQPAVVYVTMPGAVMLGRQPDVAEQIARRVQPALDRRLVGLRRN